jgi:hypothetical protein
MSASPGGGVGARSTHTARLSPDPRFQSFANLL